MNRVAIDEAAAEAERFLRAVSAVEAGEKAGLARKAKTLHYYDATPHVELAALRRSSMDLTRALARMRRYAP